MTVFRQVGPTGNGVLREGGMRERSATGMGSSVNNADAPNLMGLPFRS